MITGMIGLAVLLALIAVGMPIAFAMFVVGFGGVFALHGLDVASSLLSLTLIGQLLGSEFAALPLFILMGSFAIASGISTIGFDAARAWLYRLPGGLGVATIASSAAFAACSGSSFAAAATISRIAIPEMKKSGYSDRLSAGACAAGGLLATVIPPSGAMVIYGIASEESIGQLLIAGLLPGVMIAAFFMLGIVALTKLRPETAPPLQIANGITWRKRLSYLPRLWGIAALFGIVFFGNFFGWFTATESAGFGALAALLILIGYKRSQSRRAIVQACIECASLTATILFLILGALVFNGFLVLAGLPATLSAFVDNLAVDPIVTVIVMLCIYLVLGIFLEGAAMLLITIPIFHPIVTSLGFDGVWFGVLTVMMLEIGMLTPPFGMVAYIINSSVPAVSLPDVFKGSLMFVGLQAIVVVLVTAFPMIALWLPSHM